MSEKSARLALDSATHKVNLAKIGRQLRREATANPKKAVFLGLAVLAAAYFWTPLVLGWIGKNDKDGSAVATPSGTAPVAVAAGPQVTPDIKAARRDAETDRLPWSTIVQQMHDDPRMKTADSLTIARDPFEPPRTVVAESNAVEEEASEPKLPSVSPSAAGLVLTSTIIGPQRRVARISGKSYVQGQVIEVVRDGERLGVAFKLIEVQARRAVVEADGHRFELTIPEPQDSSKIELVGPAEKQ